MIEQLAVFFTPTEWKKLLLELDFLLRETYGEDLVSKDRRIKVQIPNILNFITSMNAFSSKEKVIIGDNECQQQQKPL